MIRTDSRVVVITCDCGMFPLADAMHRTADSAWKTAAAHVALNPTKCHPKMTRRIAPASIARLAT